MELMSPEKEYNDATGLRNEDSDPRRGSGFNFSKALNHGIRRAPRVSRTHRSLLFLPSQNILAFSGILMAKEHRKTEQLYFCVKK